VPSIVVVDDEPIVQELFSSWLENAGYTVRTAGSAMEAQRLLQSEPADVLVSDIRMAQTTGIGLLAWAREHDPDMPVVLVTGAPSVQTAVEALRLGAYDYLLKPVERSDLLRVLDRAARHRQLLREKTRLEEENRRYQERLEELVAQRTAALQRRTQQLTLLHQVAYEINALQGLSTLCQRVVEVVQETFHYLNVAILHVDREADAVVLEAVAGTYAGTTLVPGYKQPLSRSLLGRAVQEKRPVVVNDVHEGAANHGLPGEHTQAEAVFPIYVGQVLTALLDIQEDEKHAFDETDELVLRTLAEHLGVAIANARLYAQLQDALVAREQMLQNVSHELRTPLTIIRGYAELLAEGFSDFSEEDARHAASTIVTQARHLTRLVDQLIMFQRLEREETSTEEIPVAEWLNQVVAAWRPVLTDADMQLRLEIAPDVRTVRGNRDHLNQVMNNLLDNARKFSPNGGEVVIRAWREGAEVCIAISDQGVGVPPEKLPRLFERFYQVDAGTSRRFGGMGLGLALCREIIQHHDGRIWAKSAGEGKGLTVTFALPTVTTTIK